MISYLYTQPFSMKVVQGIHLRTNLVSYPNPNLLVAISKGTQIVKLCCNKIPRVLTGVLAYNGHKMVVCLYTQTCVYIHKQSQPTCGTMQNALKLQLLDTDCKNNSRLKSEPVHTNTYTHTHTRTHTTRFSTMNTSYLDIEQQSVFSFLQLLISWNCPHLLLCAVIWHGCC